MPAGISECVYIIICIAMFVISPFYTTLLPILQERAKEFRVLADADPAGQ